MSETLAAQRLIGSWELLDWRIEYGDARAATYPFGREVGGMLTYGADGYMQGTITRQRRAGLSSDSAKHAPAAERLAAFDSYFHYAGRWAAAGDRVTHWVTLALNPNLIGTEQVREMRLADDTLTLTAIDTLPGTTVQRRHALTWRRLRAEQARQNFPSASKAC
jgi:hypothetical protein